MDRICLDTVSIACRSPQGKISAGQDPGRARSRDGQISYLVSVMIRYSPSADASSDDDLLVDVPTAQKAQGMVAFDTTGLYVEKDTKVCGWTDAKRPWPTARDDGLEVCPFCEAGTDGQAV